MSSITDYEVNFPKRTRDLLVSFNKREVDYELDVTFLINCLLGLIIAAVETSKKDNVITGKVDNELINILPEEVKIPDSNKVLAKTKTTELLKWDKLDVLKKIRNGIAHQHIKPDNSNGEWKGIKLWNMKGNKKNFELHLNIGQLHELALYITKHYLTKYHQKKYK